MNDAEKIVSLGCRLNIAESAQIKTILKNDTSTLVVNSCAVTSEAVRQTRQAIRKLRKTNPEARLMVTGCASEIEREQIAAMPEVDGIIANASKLDPRAWNMPEPVSLTPPSLELFPAPSQTPTDTHNLKPPHTPSHTRAFIAVQNGCDHSCTFCVIPQGRGPSRSLTIAQTLRDIARHLEQGAPEIILTGVDVTSWGTDLPGCPPLGTLVQAILDEFPQLQRLRMSSLDGVEIDPLLEELFTDEPRLMPHLHLSLQHGHDLILKRMKRRHLREDAIALVERLHHRRPDIAIGADLIAGFPTEDEAMHQANLSIIAQLPIIHGHIFPYSPRPGTPAAKMPQVGRAIIKTRAAQLRAAVANTRAKWLSNMVGKPLSVLAEGDGAGYTGDFARVAVPAGTHRGHIVTVTPHSVEKGLLI